MSKASRIEELQKLREDIGGTIFLRDKLTDAEIELLEKYRQWDELKYWQEEIELFDYFCSYFDGIKIFGKHSIFYYNIKRLSISTGFILKQGIVFRDIEGNIIDSSDDFGYIMYNILDNTFILRLNTGKVLYFTIDCDEFLRQVSGPKSALIEDR